MSQLLQKHCLDLIKRRATSPVQLEQRRRLQTDLDILPLLTEESYLKAYPEDRKCRAFLEFCREGDYKAIVEMLQDDEIGEDDDGDEEMGDSEQPGKEIGIDRMLRY